MGEAQVRRDSAGRRTWWSPPPVPAGGPDEPGPYASALAGDTPADALTRRDRHMLVRQLWEAGWSDSRIAAHTRMTLATTARIRDELGLAARRLVS
jgi:hypothetical protein